MPRRIGLWTVLGVGMVCCTEPHPMVTSEVTVTDSSGIPWVELGALDGVAAEEWRVKEMFRASDSNVELFRVSSARLLAEGPLLIGNAGNQEVLVVGDGGKLMRRVGGEGDGPGEFRTVSTLHEVSEGFLVYDARLGRLSHFDLSGSVVNTIALVPPNRVVDLVPLAMSPKGAGLAIYGEQRIGGGEGIHQDTTPLLRYSDPGQSPDTLGLWGSDEWNYSSPPGVRWVRSPVGFGRHLSASERSGRVVIGSTNSLDLTVFDSTGTTLMRVVGTSSSRPATQVDGEAWRAELVASLPDGLPDVLLRAYQSAPYHNTYPAFEDAVMDDQGNVWIGDGMAVEHRGRRWVVVSPKGEPLGYVVLPEDSKILDVAYGRVALKEQDPSGVEDVSVYTIDMGR